MDQRTPPGPPNRPPKSAGLFLNLRGRKEEEEEPMDLPPGTLSLGQQRDQAHFMQRRPPATLGLPQDGGFVMTNIFQHNPPPAPRPFQFSQRNFPQQPINFPVAETRTLSKAAEEFYHSSSNNEDGHGTLKFEPNGELHQFIASDLEDGGEIGRGAFGSVNRMIHRKTGTEMAVKRIRNMQDFDEKKLLMDLDVVMKSSDCPYIVKFYGSVFWEGDCWICMELMSTSLDKFYRFVYRKLEARIPEPVVGRIAEATLKALHYLKEEQHIIHRDVKPSNILVDTCGRIKLCDFSISGQLIDSIAKTRDVGCRPYMAPERIEPNQTGYDVRSDVWSLGISLIELATGKFPYPKWKSVFDQLTQVVNGKPPKLRCDYSEQLQFSASFVDFINLMTISEAERRPKYDRLLAHPYLASYQQPHRDYFASVLAQMTPLDFAGEVAE